jgi:creatinase
VTQASATTVSANIDAGMPWLRSYGENIVYTDWRRDNYLYPVQQVLAEQGITGGRLGIEDDHINPDLRPRSRPPCSG